MKRLLSLVTAAVLLQGCTDKSQLETVWEAAGLRTPESVLYYNLPAQSYLLVSEIDEKGQGGIAKLAPDGEIINQDWVRGLQAPKGMAEHDGMLYVADETVVAVIDMATQEIQQRIPIEGSAFLNDVTVDDQGAVYVSDTETGLVHRLVDNEPEVYLQDLPGANGLTFVDGYLYIGAGPTLYRADASKELTKVAEDFEEGIDGIEMIAPGEFIVTCWPGLIYHVRADGSIEKLLDSRDQEVNTADIGWNPDERILYVPTFFKNTVVAYKVNLNQ